MLFRFAPALFVASLAVSAQTKTADRLYREAIDLSKTGDSQGAIAKYQELVRLVPDSVAVRTNLGVALASVGRYTEAIENYGVALRRDPGNATVRLDLALAWYKQAQFDKAAAELSEIHRTHADNKQVLLLLADCDLRLERNKEAIALAEPAFELHPEDNAVAYVLGTALIRDGQIERGQVVINRIQAGGNSVEAQLLSRVFGVGRRGSPRSDRFAEEGLDARQPGVWSQYGRVQLDNDDTRVRQSVVPQGA